MEAGGGRRGSEKVRKKGEKRFVELRVYTQQCRNSFNFFKKKLLENDLIHMHAVHHLGIRTPNDLWGGWRVGRGCTQKEKKKLCLYLVAMMSDDVQRVQCALPDNNILGTSTSQKWQVLAFSLLSTREGAVSMVKYSLPSGLNIGHCTP